MYIYIYIYIYKQDICLLKSFKSYAILRFLSNLQRLNKIIKSERKYKSEN